MDRMHEGETADGVDDGPPMPSEAELLAAMERSEQDVAAGRTVPVEEVLAELEASIQRMQARRLARRD